MHIRSTLLAFAVIGSGLLLPLDAAMADSELQELKNTIISLVDQLVKKGVLSAEEAEGMKRQAAMKAREESAAQAGAVAGGAAAGAAAGAAGSGVVRVPYVPDFIKDEIRNEVREELRQDVTNDVVAVAKAEKWGTADALPDWLSRIEVSGDFRLRGAGLYQPSSNNAAVPDVQSINEAGGFGPAGVDAFLNTTDDTTVGQVRLRLGLTAAVTDDFSVVTRLATGNDINPTTRNQRLGTNNEPFDIFVDLAYGEWRHGEATDSRDFAIRGGRLPNPFVSTSLLFDDDLTFDGVTGSYRQDMFGRDKAFFVNLGGFALLAESPNLVGGGANDKYWWGTQVGLEFDITEDLGLMLVGSYYDFVNVVGKYNDLNSTGNDWTAPEFIAKGNTVFDIRNDLDPDSNLFGLASDFELASAMVELAYRGFSPVDVVFRVDYVENIGFDSGAVSSRIGYDVAERTQGWFTELEVGSPDVRKKGQWQLFAGYKSLERDAVLDSFTDSDFHAGGTDAEGWLLGGSYAIASNLWLRARWLSADEIDGAPVGFENNGTPVSFTPLAIDVLQVDLNAKF
jgi:hypothetical protein